MVGWANHYNRSPDKCRYHVNTAPDLAIFTDGSFSFVYSHLVLQHMAPEVARGYIGEFVRVLEPGGLLVFHVPSHEFPGEMDSGLPASAADGPLPESAFRAEIVPARPVVEVAPAEATVIKVLVRNVSDRSWPALGGGDGAGQVMLGGRWLDSDGRALGYPEQRSRLPRDVPAGGAIELFLCVEVPRTPALYRLELDMVQERVCWFAERGSPTARVDFPAGAPADAEAGSHRSALRAERTPLRRRYPSLHRLSRSLGVVPMFRAVQRAHAHWKATGLTALRSSKRIMDMNGVPKSEVLQLLRRAGGTLLHAEPIEMTGAGWQSYRYWVTKSDATVGFDEAREWRRPLQARILAEATSGPLEVRPGGAVSIPLVLRNDGGLPWVAATTARRGAVFLGGHLLDSRGEVAAWDFVRQPLPSGVTPGEAVTLACSFRAPGRPGSCTVRLDLVMEGVCWFETHGSAPLELKLDVTAEATDSRSPGLLMARITVSDGVRAIRSATGSLVRLPLRIANEGNTLWLDRPVASGGYVAVGGHLYGASRELLALDLFRTLLPRAVAPGEAVELLCEFRAPDRAGRYLVEIDMVDEGIAWFGAHGSPTLEIDLDLH
jgi:hypothetical protein